MKLVALKHFFLAGCIAEGTTIPQTLSIVTGQEIEDLGNGKFKFDGKTFNSPYLSCTIKAGMTKEVETKASKAEVKAPEAPKAAPVVAPSKEESPKETELAWEDLSNSQKINKVKSFDMTKCQELIQSEKHRGVIKALEARMAELAG